MKILKWMSILLVLLMLPHAAWAEATLPPRQTLTPRPAESAPTPLPTVPPAAPMDIPQLPTVSAGELLEENVVYVLPTLEPEISLQLDVVENEYAIDLEAFYADQWAEYVAQKGNSTVYPALAADELLRFPEIKARYDAGHRAPEGVDSILNRTENVSIGVYPLPMEMYHGEQVFLLLPDRLLTDDELLLILDTYAALDLTFDPEALSWRNCMRGGTLEYTRAFIGDENQRMDSLMDLYRRGVLLPEEETDLMPGRDGVGRVSLNPEEYGGADSFSFIPGCRMSDPNLLKLAAMNIGELNYALQDYAGWESLARLQMHTLFGMPVTVERISESTALENQLRPYGAERQIYQAEFENLTDPAVWKGELSIEDGSLVFGCVQFNSASGVCTPMDPYLPKWTDIATDWVKQTRQDGVGIARTENYGQINLLNGDYGVEIHVIMEDESRYNVSVSYSAERPLFVVYRDPSLSRLWDEYNVSHTYEDAMRGWGE